jgi:hypothetical protein
VLFPILGILALGKVLRGIYLVIEINEGNGNEILSKSIVSTIFVYTIGFTALYLYRDVYIFSMAFALGWITYWFGSLFLFFKKKSGIATANKMAVFFFTSVGALAGIGMLVRRLIYGFSGNVILELALSILLTSVVFLGLFALLYSKDAAALKGLLARKK